MPPHRRCRGRVFPFPTNTTAGRSPTRPRSDCVSTSATPGPSRLTFTAWLIVVIAAIGFAFDIYELLMAPLVLGPAVRELLGKTPADPGFQEAVGMWRALMFYAPAVAGGLFGLLGGYLTDRLGR